MKARRLLTFERKEQAADVLVVTNGWPNEDDGTYCVFIRRQMESLIERGLRCDVLFIRGYRSPLAYPVGALRMVFWSLAGRRRYKLVHAHSGEAAAVAACYWRAPLLVSYLGDDLLGSPRLDASVSPVWKLRRTVVRRLTGLANRTITKSREMETVLPLHVRARNTVLPNGVDTDLFRPIDGSLARRQLGWEVDRPIVLFAANPAVPRKRYFLAEAAVERARSELPGLKLKVARGVTPDHMPLLMNAADCLLLTSSVEGSPNVVKEALMCNLPVVATPSGDVAELLDGVEPSYLCPPSEAALADALVDCLREPKRSNGREVSARLDATVIADSLIRIYKEIAPGIELLTAARHESAAAETAS